MKFRFYALIIFTFSTINILLLIYLSGTNRLATNDEARSISAGVAQWHNGEFGLANDNPPLARMIAVLPLLPLNVKTKKEAPETGQFDDIADARERELSRAGEFAHLNPKPFNLVLLARMIGFVWWLLGALIIFRWSDQLYGKKAGYFGVTLWSFCPIVLGYEQLATPELPSAVASLAAVYAFRGYLLLPTWNRTLVVGQLLGVALLTDFTSLALLVIFVFLSFVSQSRRADYRSLPFRLHNQVLHSVLSIGLALLVVNMGYGFNHSGSTLGTFGFPNRVPAGFHGTWLGRVIVPLPAEYVKGLVRRWHEWARPPLIDGEDKWPVEVGGRSPSTVGGDFPFSIQAILFGCLILAARRQPGSPPLAEALTLWVPLLTFLAMSTRMVAALPPASGTLLATPFAIIITSKITQCYSSRRQIVRWLAFGLSVWCLGDCVKSTHDRFFLRTEQPASGRTWSVRAENWDWPSQSRGRLSAVVQRNAGSSIAHSPNRKATRSTTLSMCRKVIAAIALFPCSCSFTAGEIAGIRRRTGCTPRSACPSRSNINRLTSSSSARKASVDPGRLMATTPEEPWNCSPQYRSNTGSTRSGSH